MAQKLIDTTAHSSCYPQFVMIKANVIAESLNQILLQGFNTWNLYGCSVNHDILVKTAQAVHDSGLQAVGYEYINSDDCWMLPNRTADGRQIADPSKFPEGFQAVTKAIHALGLKSGLYTAKGPHTCQKKAASCDHEAIDAKQWAAWGIDYVKVIL